jgi:hypothetical protein
LLVVVDLFVAVAVQQELRVLAQVALAAQVISLLVVLVQLVQEQHLVAAVEALDIQALVQMLLVKTEVTAEQVEAAVVVPLH